jgi:hypothetical protein
VFLPSANGIQTVSSQKRLPSGKRLQTVSGQGFCHLKRRWDDERVSGFGFRVSGFSIEFVVLRFGWGEFHVGHLAFSIYGFPEPFSLLAFSI